MMTQKETVLRKLREVGINGLPSFWGYRNYIPRLSAVILLLKKDGHDIASYDNKKDAGCTYFLREKRVAVVSPQSVFGPAKRRFVKKDSSTFAVVETVNPNYQPSAKALYNRLSERYEQFRIADVPIYTYYFKK